MIDEDQPLHQRALSQLTTQGVPKVK